MNSRIQIALAVLAITAVLMLAELWWSRRNERQLLGRGAVEPDDEVYATMRWAYPGIFVAMAVEGIVRGGAAPEWLRAGAVVFALAKALKYWAIRSLGPFWTYRVLVVPGEPLVSRGPYRVMRHPNYLAVLGELVGFGLIMGAWITGPLVTLWFVSLLRRRVRAEEKALHLS